MHHINGLVQDCSISIALAIALGQNELSDVKHCPTVSFHDAHDKTWLVYISVWLQNTCILMCIKYMNSEMYIHMYC